MDKGDTWITARQLIKRWNIQDFEVWHYIKEKGLKAYDVDLEPYGFRHFHTNEIREFQGPAMGMHQAQTKFRIQESLHCVFKLSDVMRMEEKHGITPRDHSSVEDYKDVPSLEAREKRELGQLRNEKAKWDDSIRAAVHIGIFCNELNNRGIEITREKFLDEIYNAGFEKVPNTTQDKIWKAIPEEYRKKSGRPRKRQDPE